MSILPICITGTPVLGVQWHPEDPAADISQLRALLAHLDARRAPRLESASTTLVA